MNEYEVLEYITLDDHEIIFLHIESLGIDFLVYIFF